MPVRQYVYFNLFSTHTSAAEMTARLGVEPDESSARGDRRAEPAIPVRHRWKIKCAEPGLCVDDQILHVLARLRPHLDPISELAHHLREEDPPGGATLQVVRYFNDADSSDTPNLFGWHLGQDILAFLNATGAALDVDEYDLSN